MSDISFSAILPELILCIFGILVMVLGPFLGRNSRSFGGTLALLGFATSIVGALLVPESAGKLFFNGMVTTDAFSIFFRVLFAAIGVVMTLGSLNYLHRLKLPTFEYFALLLFASAGMNFMVLSTDLLLTFIGLEILSIATYVLAGIRRDDAASNESAIKYFFMGSFSSAILLYGVALIYGSAHSTSYQAILKHAAAVNGQQQIPLLFLIGFGLIIVGFCFKVAVVPFQVWAPDVYEGAPTPITGFLSVASKMAGFAALIRILFQVLPHDLPQWVQLLVVSSILTMWIGNLSALTQTNIKRMLAYSSIAHAGYILIGIVAANQTGITAILYYAVAYALMNLGAFTIITILSGRDDRRVTLEDYKGIGFQYPQLSFPLTICLISLAGIPTTAGFIGKFFLFSAAVEEKMYLLAVLAVLAALVSVYYYLRVVVYMFMFEPDGKREVRIHPAAGVVVLVCCLLIFWFGLFPTWLLEVSRQAVILFLHP
ncbi:MAG: NADH-quinone oxidoreductase subunit N [Acidobacteria bacterium]|nr:NADH-quinone oxidoreductase subunit N [Acidobacteriota bacterium]